MVMGGGEWEGESLTILSQPGPRMWYFRSAHGDALGEHVVPGIKLGSVTCKSCDLTSVLFFQPQK